MAANIRRGNLVFAQTAPGGAPGENAMKNHLLAAYIADFNELYRRRPQDRRRVRREIAAGLVTLGIIRGAPIFLGMVT